MSKITAKQKCDELVQGFMDFVDGTLPDTILQNAKKCALISVEEILKDYNTKILSGRPSHLEACKGFWDDVKDEIIKIQIKNTLPLLAFLF